MTDFLSPRNYRTHLITPARKILINQLSAEYDIHATPSHAVAANRKFAAVALDPRTTPRDILERYIPDDITPGEPVGGSLCRGQLVCVLKSSNDQIRGADIGDRGNLSSHGRRGGRKKRRTYGEVGEDEKRNDKERAKKEGAGAKKKKGKEQEDGNWRKIKKNVRRCRMLTGGIARRHFSKNTRGRA